MLRPFVPCRDHALSQRFYEALGFKTVFADARIAMMSNGPDSFLLQNFYVKELADNFMLQLTVPDVHEWWTQHDPEKVAERFSAKSPVPPSLQPWGLIVAYVYDPAGVLWHVTQAQG